MMDTDRVRLGKVLVQLALSNRSQSSRAVYYAIIALASQHCNQNSIEVIQLKHAALQGLYSNDTPNIDDGIEHVAANLLLCVFEVCNSSMRNFHYTYTMKMQQTVSTNSCWVGHISGMKQMIEVIKQSKPPQDSDASLILGWVYYFDIMARFSFRHWRTEEIKAVARSLGFDSQGERSCAIQYILAQKSFAQGVPDLASHAHPVMQLLAEVSDVAMYSSEPRYTTTDYQLHLDDLRSKLESESLSVRDSLASKQYGAIVHSQILLQLLRLAALIYLERVSRNFSGQSAKLESWTRQAFLILNGLDSCLCPFALFIIGCEACKDEDRIVILKLYANMEKRPYLQSFMASRSLIQTAWNQQDLAHEGELEYIRKLNLVVSSRDLLPSFV
jgi:hypothetical protein